MKSSSGIFPDTKSSRAEFTCGETSNQESYMDLPIQAPPVMRGQQRIVQSQQAVDPVLTQSQLPGLGGIACNLCSLLPSPWNTICEAVCKNVH